MSLQLHKLSEHGALPLALVQRLVLDEVDSLCSSHNKTHLHSLVHKLPREAHICAVSAGRVTPAQLSSLVERVRGWVVQGLMQPHSALCRKCSGDYCKSPSSHCRSIHCT